MNSNFKFFWGGGGRSSPVRLCLAHTRVCWPQLCLAHTPAAAIAHTLIRAANGSGPPSLALHTLITAGRHLRQAMASSQASQWSHHCLAQASQANGVIIPDLHLSDAVHKGPKNTPEQGSSGPENSMGQKVAGKVLFRFLPPSPSPSPSPGPGPGPRSYDID